MGRELRRVPMGWQHPKNEHGHYVPMYDQTYQEALLNTDGDWTPNPLYYRPVWPENAVMGYCVYEDVTEGTPISPVFSSAYQVYSWLRDQGYSVLAAANFVEMKWSPSMAMISGQIIDGIAAMEYIRDEDTPASETAEAKS